MNNNGNDHEMDDPNQVTTDQLRIITKVPAVRSLLKDEKFPLEHIQSERPKWRSPILKLLLGGTGLGGIFFVLVLVLWGKHQQAKVETPPQNIAAAPNPLTQENARLQKENAKLKVNGALIDQTGIDKRLQALREATNKPSTSRAGDRPTSRPQTAAARPASPSRTVAVSPSPRVQTSPPSVSRPAPIARSTSAVPSRSAEAESDPMERWQALARLGSYGSIQPESSQTEKFSNSEQVNRRVLQAMQNAPYDVASTAVPTARIAPTSAVQDFQPEFSSRFSPTITPTESDEGNSEPDDRASSELQQEESLEQTVSEASEPDHSSEPIVQMPPESPPVLEEEEAQILASADRQHSLTVGTRAEGELITPVVVTGNNADRFTIKLTQPLMDNQGQTAFPEGTELVVQVDSVAETGQVHLSAIAATWSIDGQQRELMLPPGAIQVRGERGEPLVAEHFDDRGDEIAGMDAGQFLLGAAGRAAQLYTRSGSQIQTRSSSTVITEENLDPNILAGLVEGGTDAVLESIQERNQRAIERMEELPNIRFIDTGTEVEIFVNQSIFMPM
jgi:Bacterial conjugation TrbI-like protein